MPKTKTDWLRMIAALAYVGVSIGFYLILRPYLSDPQATQDQLRAAGVLGPIIYMALYSLQVYIPFLPGVSMDMVCGALWGVGSTLVFSLGAATFSGAVVISLVRALGLDTIDQRYPALLRGPWRFVRLAERWPWTLAIVSTLAGDVSYFVAGATRITLGKAILVIGLARVPGVLIYAIVGWSIETGRVSPAIAERFGMIVPVLALLTVAGLMTGAAILTRYGKHIIERLENTLDKPGSAGEKPEVGGGL